MFKSPMAVKEDNYGGIHPLKQFFQSSNSEKPLMNQCKINIIN